MAKTAQAATTNPPVSTPNQPTANTPTVNTPTANTPTANTPTELLETEQFPPNNVVPLVNIFDDAENYAGAGTSDRAEDNLVPFLILLQKQSPQVNDRKSTYIQGAKAGMLLDSATRKLYNAEGNEGPLVIVAHSEVMEVEWIPRGQGGGFVERHPVNTPLLKQITEVPNPERPDSKRKMRMLPNGHQLVTTAYYYIIPLDTMTPMVLSLGTASGWQTHRRWNTMLRNRKRARKDGSLFVPPSFLTVTQLKTTWIENDQGDWYNVDPVVETARWIDPSSVSEVNAYQIAVEFHKLAMAGEVKVGAEDGVEPASATDDNTYTGPDPDSDALKDESPI